MLNTEPDEGAVCSNGALHPGDVNTSSRSEDSSRNSESDSDDTMYFSDCDVQFLPEPAEPNDYTIAAYEVMYDVMSKQMVHNWRAVRSIFAEQFDPTRLCKEEYTGPKPRQFKTFERKKKPDSAARSKICFENAAKTSPAIKSARQNAGKIAKQSNEHELSTTPEHAMDDSASFDLTTDGGSTSRITVLQSSVWPADCCEACRLQNITLCQCPVNMSMPQDMLDGEDPSTPRMDMQPVVRALKLSQQPADVRIVLPHGSHQHIRIARMQFGRALKYPTYETRYVKPLPAGNFWLPLANNMHARDQITYRVVPYISEDIDIGKWEAEYSEMHEQRRDRAAYRRVRERLFNNTPALTEVVRRMKRQLKKSSTTAPAPVAEADDAKFEQNIFQALSSSVPNAPSPDELFEQKYRFPNDASYRNVICLPSLDADPTYDCPYEKRMHTYMTLYCPKCRFFDCHEHEHKQCAPQPQLELVPLTPPPEEPEKWCSPTDCFATIYDKKRHSDLQKLPPTNLSVCAKVYLADVLHELKVIPGYYANNSNNALVLLQQAAGQQHSRVSGTGAARSSITAVSGGGGSSLQGGLGEPRLCCDVAKMVNDLLIDAKEHVTCADVYRFYLSLVAQQQQNNRANGGSHSEEDTVKVKNDDARAAATRGGRRRGGGTGGGQTASGWARKRSSFKQAPAYKAMQSSRQLSKVPHEPCHHPEFASCLEAGEACVCARRKIFCEKYCSCDDRCCGNRVRLCTCTSGCNSLRCPCFVAERECDPQRCRCEQIGMCKNMALQLGLKKKIVVAQSSTHGFGVFIMEDAREGEFIYEYMGEKVSDYEAERRGRFYDKLGLSFLFGLNAEESIDATRCGNKIRFANHSERHPNLAARIMSVFGDHRIGLYALRDLKRGEELFFNYFYKGNHLKFVPNEIRFATNHHLMHGKSAAASAAAAKQQRTVIDEDDAASVTKAAENGVSSAMGKREKNGNKVRRVRRKRKLKDADSIIAASNDDAVQAGADDEHGAAKRRSGSQGTDDDVDFSGSRRIKRSSSSLSAHGSFKAGEQQPQRRSRSRSPSYRATTTGGGTSSQNGRAPSAGGVLDALLGEVIDEDDGGDVAIDLSFKSRASGRN